MAGVMARVGLKKEGWETEMWKCLGEMTDGITRRGDNDFGVEADAELNTYPIFEQTSAYRRSRS